jgi:hypothetical protein
MTATPPKNRWRDLLRASLPMWGLRLILGAVLLTISEVVMWQNPLVRRPLDWLGVAVLYVALAALLLDFTVRFQVRHPSSLLLLGGAYAVLQSATLNPGVFDSFPITLVVRGLGLQTAAAVYGLLLFVTVMRGKQPGPWHWLGAVAIGAIWGIWLHWYPLQAGVNWGLVPLATGQTYAALLLISVGVLFFVIGPRFRVVREDRLQLVLWERVSVAAVLFVALLLAMAQALIPLLPLLVLIALGAYIAWALNFQRGGYDPSLLAQITFAAPNLITYITLAVVFFVVGSLSYGLIADRDSLVGVVVYYLVLAFGALGLPAASVLIFFAHLNRRAQETAADDD